MATGKSDAIKRAPSLPNNFRVSTGRVNATGDTEIMKARRRLLDRKAIEDSYTVHGNFSAHDVNTTTCSDNSFDQDSDDVYYTIGEFYKRKNDADMKQNHTDDQQKTDDEASAERLNNVTSALEISLTGSDELFDHPDLCSECTTRKAGDSVAYCATCKKYFCKICRDKHANADTSKGHMIFDKHLTVFAGKQKDIKEKADAPVSKSLPSFKEHRVGFKDGEKCSIVAIKKMVFNGYIIADSYNNKIMFLSEGFYVQGTIDLPGNPRDVCCITSKDIAVTESKFVHIISSGSRSNRMIFGHECYGICHRYGLMYVADGQYSVHVYKINGEKVKCINLSTCGFEKPKTAELVEMSNNGKELYVIGESQGLITLTLSGSVVSNYVYTEISLDLAFTQGDDESFFLSGKSSKNVIQVSGSEQDELKVIIEDLSAFPPSAICWDSKGRKLLIASKDRNFLRVYNLS